MKIVGMLAAATFLTAVSIGTAASAEDFRFTITGDAQIDGLDIGTQSVTGEIFGLTEGTDVAATAVILNNPEPIGPLYLNFGAGGDFDVSNGEITSGAFDSTIGAFPFLAGLTLDGNNSSAGILVFPILEATISGSVNYAALCPTVSAAPEPGVWALMLAGVAMIGGMLRLGRKRGAGSFSAA